MCDGNSVISQTYRVVVPDYIFNKEVIISNSYRKTPVFGMTTAESEKEYKRAQHQIERSRVRDAIALGDYESIEVELAPYNAWDAPCDGKHYWSGKIQMGWGVHNPPTKKWSPETVAERIKKSMRK
jgi:hypothetical protein